MENNTPTHFKLHMELHLSLTSSDGAIVYEDIHADSTFEADNNNYKLCRKQVVDTTKTMLETLYTLKLPQKEVRTDDERANHTPA